jgi:hypothetical protein
MAKKSKARAKKPAKKAAAGKSAVSPVLLLSKDAVKSLARRVRESKARQGNISKGVRDEMESAKAKGLDGVAFNLALRWASMMDKNSAQTSLRWDQFRYVLFECLGFEDHYQKPLPFKKRNGRKEAQTDLKDRADLPKDEIPVAAETERPESEAVH